MPQWVIILIQMMPQLVQEIITIINAIQSGTITDADRERLLGTLSALNALIDTVTPAVKNP